jgi:dihydrofolate reductase
MVDGRVIWHTTMSLDGFVAGRDDAMDWAFGADLGPSAAGTGVVGATGAIVAGRRWYDRALERPEWAPYGGSWQGPLIVVTNRPHSEPASPGDGLSVTFVATGIGDAVVAARAAAGGRDVVVFGPTIARQCLDSGLLDEILVHVVPVLLGDGVRFFGDPGVGHRIPLRRTELVASGQLTDLRFTVGRPS